MHLNRRETLWTWLSLKQKKCIFCVWNRVKKYELWWENPTPSPSIISLLLIFSSPSLKSQPSAHPISGWAETKRIRIIPPYPCTVFFNIYGMSSFICSVLCYTRNARFTVSSQGWAPSESRRSPMQPPHPTPPPILNPISTSAPSREALVQALIKQGVYWYVLPVTKYFHKLIKYCLILSQWQPSKTKPEY